jgi:hypothetical protein
MLFGLFHSQQKLLDQPRPLKPTQTLSTSNIRLALRSKKTTKLGVLL